MPFFQLNDDHIDPDDLGDFDPETVPRALAAFGGRMVTKGMELAMHAHRKDELVLTMRGIVRLEAGHGVWIVPPRCAVWIPGHVPHSVSVAGDVEEYVKGSRSAAVEEDDDITVNGSQSATIGGRRPTEISGTDYASISGSRVESIEGNLQLVVDGQTYQSHGSLYVSVTGETSYSYTSDMKLESSTIMKIGAPKVYVAAGTNLYLRALESITLEVGSSKLTIENGKVTVTDGGAEKTLTGDTIFLNC